MAKKENANTIMNWFEYGILFRERFIFLEGQRVTDEEDIDEVASHMVNKFIKGMEILESSGSKEITIILSTPGGCQYSGFAIYDRIKESPCHIIIRGYGQIMSMGTIILQAGDRRELAPNTWIMIHEGKGWAEGSTKSMLNWVSSYKEMEDRGYKIYYDKMVQADEHITLVKIKNMCKDDNTFCAEKAVELGLADTIYKGKNKKLSIDFTR